MVFCFYNDSKLKHRVYVISQFLHMGADLHPKEWYISAESTGSARGNGVDTVPWIDNLKGTSALVRVE